MRLLHTRAPATKWVLDSASVIPADPAKAAAVGVVRYVSAYPTKNLTVAEYQADKAASVAVALVYEDGPLDFLGSVAGTAKAHIAEPILAGLEFEAHRPVYCSFDTGPAGVIAEEQYELGWQAIEAFAGALDRPPAAYGPRPFLAWLNRYQGVKYLWEFASSAYNTGARSAATVLAQTTEQKVVGGVLCDLNEVLASDWGQSPSPIKEIPDMVLFLLTDQPAGTADAWLSDGFQRRALTVTEEAAWNAILSPAGAVHKGAFWSILSDLPVAGAADPTSTSIKLIGELSGTLVQA